MVMRYEEPMLRVRCCYQCRVARCCCGCRVSRGGGGTLIMMTLAALAPARPPVLVITTIDGVSNNNNHNPGPATATLLLPPIWQCACNTLFMTAPLTTATLSFFGHKVRNIVICVTFNWMSWQSSGGPIQPHSTPWGKHTWTGNVFLWGGKVNIFISLFCPFFRILTFSGRFWNARGNLACLGPPVYIYNN